MTVVGDLGLAAAALALAVMVAVGVVRVVRHERSLSRRVRSGGR